MRKISAVLVALVLVLGLVSFATTAYCQDTFDETSVFTSAVSDDNGWAFPKFETGANAQSRLWVTYPEDAKIGNDGDVTNRVIYYFPSEIINDIFLAGSSPHGTYFQINAMPSNEILYELHVYHARIVDGTSEGTITCRTIVQ